MPAVDPEVGQIALSEVMDRDEKESGQGNPGDRQPNQTVCRHCSDIEKVKPQLRDLRDGGERRCRWPGALERRRDEVIDRPVRNSEQGNHEHNNRDRDRVVRRGRQRHNRRQRRDRHHRLKDSWRRRCPTCSQTGDKRGHGRLVMAVARSAPNSSAAARRNGGHGSFATMRASLPTVLSSSRKVSTSLIGVRAKRRSKIVRPCSGW